MNVCILSGVVPRPPIATGDGRLIRLLITTKFRFFDNASKEGTTAVPCVIVDPSDHLRAQLLDAGIEGRRCECWGRIERTGFDGPDGSRRYATEMLIDGKSMVIHRERRRPV